MQPTRRRLDVLPLLRLPRQLLRLPEPRVLPAVRDARVEYQRPHVQVDGDAAELQPLRPPRERCRASRVHRDPRDQGVVREGLVDIQEVAEHPVRAHLHRFERQTAFQPPRPRCGRTVHACPAGFCIGCLCLAEFGSVYRWEQSGELNGMTRVRGFTQDDAHLFCTEEQIGQEIKGCLDLVKLVFNTLGMSDYRVRIGLRDSDSTKYVGDSEKWDMAEEALREAAQTLDVDFIEEPGEAAFYGPMIDFVVKDVIGREWQLGTVQVDYNLPERFDLSYIGADNEKHRPVMIHRAPFGSMERFCGVLIEHFAGNFPIWLAPEQVRILPMNDELVPQAREIEKLLKAAKVRVTVDDIADKLGAKIRKCHVDKVPTFLVLGRQEAEQGLVKVNSRTNASLEGLKTPAEFMGELLMKIADKSLPEPKED